MSKVEFYINNEKMSSNEMDKWVAKFWGVEIYIDPKWYCRPMASYKTAESCSESFKLLQDYPDWYNRLAESMVYSDLKMEHWTAQDLKENYLRPFTEFPFEELMKIPQFVPYVQLLDEWIRCGVRFRIPSNAPVEVEVKRVPRHIEQEIDYGSELAID